MRVKIAANSFRGTATSANWKITYFECDTTLAPILTSFSRRAYGSLVFGGVFGNPRVIF